MPLNQRFHMVINLKRIVSSLFLLSAMSFSLIAVAETEFKIIDLQHRFAEDILPAIQPLAGSNGVVSGTQNHLIIRTSPERMREIERVITSLDVVSQNLKITVSLQNNLQSSQDAINVRGRKRVGNVEISSDKYPSRADDGVQVGIATDKSNSQNKSMQFINIMDGMTAFIRVGQSVPFTQEWLTLTNRYLNAQQTTEFVDITTGFSVRPRSIGNQIELEVTPRIAKLNQNDFIDFEELSTIVRVDKGEWLDLGGIMQQKDDVSHMILSRHNSSQSQNNSLSIRVD